MFQDLGTQVNSDDRTPGVAIWRASVAAG